MRLPTLTATLFVFLSVTAPGAVELRDCAVGGPPPDAIVSALDTFLSDAVDPASQVAQEGLQAPGAVLLVQTPDWSYFKSAGLADIGTREMLDCAMPYEIGSATKMMTGTVIMQLQEEGKLSLDDGLSNYLPDIADRLPFGERMTLRQLSTHTSGVFSYTDNAPDGARGIMEGAMADPNLLKARRSPAELVEFVIEHGEPNFEPGAEGQWAYSNTGYVLLGLIIEKIEGRQLAEVFQDRIFAPAGMSETFLWNDVPKPEFGLPRAWYKAPFDFETTEWNLSQGWAAGAVISTAPDMARFLEALLSGKLFTEAATLAAMLDGVKAPFPHVSYGIGLAEKPGRIFGHGGQTLGFESDAGFMPDSGTTIIFWTNAASTIAVLGLPLIAQAMTEAGAQ